MCRFLAPKQFLINNYIKGGNAPFKLQNGQEEWECLLDKAGSGIKKIATFPYLWEKDWIARPDEILKPEQDWGTAAHK